MFIRRSAIFFYSSTFKTLPRGASSPCIPSVPSNEQPEVCAQRNTRRAGFVVRFPRVFGGNPDGGSMALGITLDVRRHTCSGYNTDGLPSYTLS